MSKIEDPEIRIKHVTPQMREDLRNIAKNIGVTLSAMLKSKLRDIRDSYPEHLRKPYKD